jgi:hypothetical protein
VSAFVPAPVFLLKIAAMFIGMNGVVAYASRSIV